MTSRPDARVVPDLLARARRRLVVSMAARGVSAGLVLALLIALVARRSTPLGLGAIAAALTALGAIAGGLMVRRRRSGVARLIEQRAPQCRNLIITAHELSAAGRGGYVAELVARDATRVAQTVDVSIVIPLRGALLALAAAALAWTAGVTFVAAPATSRVAAVRAIVDGSAPKVGRLDVEITPPAYAARAESSTRDPARIVALAGSTLRLSIDASAERLVVETLRRRDTVGAVRPGFFTATVVADADGYIALEPIAGDGTAGDRRLIGLSVTPDAAPRVRITAPGRDVFLKDGHATIDVAIDATDDIGLSSLRLRYTKVSGSGERFSFAEGEVPLSIARRDARTWSASVHWSLAPLSLDAGDMVVYRAIATDGRPGAAPSESDSFIAEVVAPGGVAAAGFSLDPDQERYAVSQQMVILKTERLLAKRATVTPEAFAAESQEIAVEQRKVRAEFVFMLGGELVDAPDVTASMTDINEEAEAAGESDLLAGRNANAGHIALLRAIRAMSRASTALNTAAVDSALPHERVALTNLEQAFSRARIILRAFSERERLDLSRRLTGTLSDASRDVRPMQTQEVDATSASLRRALASLATIGGEARLSPSDASRISDLAQDVLRINPALAALQSASASLASATTALRDGREDRARIAIDRATTAIATQLRNGAPSGAVTDVALEGRILQSALNDAVRTPGTKP